MHGSHGPGGQSHDEENHGHGAHSHLPHPAHRDGFGSLVRVLILSGGFMVAEIVGGLWSGSLALLADSGHMAIDTAAVALSLFAMWIARKPPTDQRTFGYLRAEILAAALNGALLVVASVWIFYEAWDRVHHPHVIRGEGMTIIAIGGLIVNLVGLRLVHRHSEGHLGFKSVTLHLLFDALGSVAAILAGLAVWLGGVVWADTAVSVLIAIFILHGAFKLLSECVDILLESVPSGIQLDKIRNDLSSINGVKDVHDLHVWSLASGVIALSAHLKVVEGGNHGEVLRRGAELLQHEHGIGHATLQLEPEAYSHEDTHLDCDTKKS